MDFSLDSIPEPRGALVPPPRVPPTAIATASPSPAPERRPRVVRTNVHGRSALLRAAAVALDVADVMADAVREWATRRAHSH